VVALIVIVPLALGVIVSAWLLVRARPRSASAPRWLKTEIGSPSAEADAMQRWLYPYRYPQQPDQQS
jgi:hypothetical protein